MSLCKKCGESIEGETVSVGGNDWHAKCFTCSKCNNTITWALFSKLDGVEVLCKNCSPNNSDTEESKEFDSTKLSPSCPACLKPISSALYKSWHPKCFCCKRCSKQLKNVFYQDKKKVYCNYCYLLTRAES